MDEHESYTILRQCVDIRHVQEARRALEDHLAVHPAPQDTGVVMVHLFGSFEDWPPACKTLREKVEEAIPFVTYVPWQNYMSTSSIAVFQSNRRQGRGQSGSYFYTICLDESLEAQNGMPQYIPGSHNVHDLAILNSMPKSQIHLREGDVLVWKGSTAFSRSGGGGGGRFMLIRLSPQ